MPELPELEALRIQLGPRLQDRVITAVEINPKKGHLLRYPPDDFARELPYRRVTRAWRRGKHLGFETELVRGGEAQKSRVENVPALSDLALALGARLRLIGHNVIQCFRGHAGALSLIEVNPRFGGASNLSIVAGLDTPRRLVELISGDRSALAPRPIRHGLGMLRYSRDVIVEPDEIERLAAAH